MTRSAEIDVRQFWFTTPKGGDARCMKLGCGPTFVERIVPPGGEEYAFDVQHYRRNVEVYVSPTGRSVRVWVDGVEVPA